MAEEEDKTPYHSAAAAFENTHWTCVLTAAQQDSAGSHAALETLCSKYWPPIYAFLRRQGRNVEDAKDLTQGFFSHLLQGSRLQNVDPARGKFRSFLLACLNNYVRNEADKQNAQKRGSGQTAIPILISDPDQTAGFEPRTNEDPVSAFERQWARTLITGVLDKLKERCAANGKGEIYECLSAFLTDEAERGDYAVAAARLGLSEGATRTAATRLRNEYRKLLLSEIRQTVKHPEEVEAEIRYLLRALVPSNP